MDAEIARGSLSPIGANQSLIQAIGNAVSLESGAVPTNDFSRYIAMCAIQVSTCSAKLMNSEVIDYIPSIW